MTTCKHKFKEIRMALMRCEKCKITGLENSAIKKERERILKALEFVAVKQAHLLVVSLNDVKRIINQEKDE